MARIEQVNVPDIGNFKDVDVIEIAVKVGDIVKAEESLITLESDKATMDVPAPFAGVVKEILIQEGQKASQGTPILLLEIMETSTVGTPLNQEASAATPSNRTQTVEVPDIGNFKDVDVIEIAVKVGDTVKVEESLITLESDKATMDVPAPFAGVVKEILIQEGQKASQGTPILLLEIMETSTVSTPLNQEASAATPSNRTQTVEVPDIGNFKDVDVIEIAVKVGDIVKAEESLITLESDKATMDVPAPFAGIVKEILIQEGQKASQGTPILLLEIMETSTVGTPLNQEASAATPSNRTQTVEVPDIGNFKDVDVIEIAVKVGDTVKVEESLITLESDKATMDVPAPFAGVVKEILIQEGQKASKGTPILVLETQEANATPAIPQSLPPLSAQTVVASLMNPVPAFDTKPPMELVGSIPSANVVKQAKEEVRTALGKKSHAGPSVRRFARELGVDLSFVSGTGPKGRIIKTDVQTYVKAELAKPRGEAAQTGGQGGGLGFNLPAWPNVDFAQFGPIEAKPLTRIQKLSGPNLHRNWISIPHVTQFDQADITELEQFRKDMGETAKKRDVKLTMLAFLLKASAAALKAYPKFNTSLSTDGTELIYKGYCHIGVAVDTPDGLVVPVVRDVDQKGIFDLAKDLGELSQKARDKKLSAADMQGGCFTISSLGGIGGTAFTPIINAPEVAILGVSRSSIQPVYKDGQFVPRLMLPLSLSYDHRVIDGAAAARFTNYLAEVLSDIRRLVL